MRKKNYKGRCEKLSVSKSKDVCRMYSELQKKYLYKLQDNEHIQEIRCNVLMEGLEGDYTSDFVCVTNTSDEIMNIDENEKIVQAVFIKYGIADEEEVATERTGGIGSTGK